jgi:hypothetical protein
MGFFILANEFVVLLILRGKFKFKFFWLEDILRSFIKNQKEVNDWLIEKNTSIT